MSARRCWAVAVHFSFAASFFDEVHPVGPGGDDFGEAELDVLRARGIHTDVIEHVPGGKTFLWSGVYGWDLNDRETLDTQLNVFADFALKLSEASKSADVVFLASIQPDLQRDVRPVPRRPFRCAGLDELSGSTAPRTRSSPRSPRPTA